MGNDGAIAYTGPWPPKQSSLVLPNDYAVGLTPKQVMLLVKINMQHLPVPPQPGVFPGVMSKSTSEEKDSLKKLIAALDRMAKFTQTSVLTTPLGPPPVWGVGGMNASGSSGSSSMSSSAPLRTPAKAGNFTILHNAIFQQCYYFSQLCL